MFQNNPLLHQLKQQIRESKPQVEGIVRASDKTYGFLECDKKSYFLPPAAMKKLIHGDKINAYIETLSDEREQAEPIALLETTLTRFIATVRFNKDQKLQLVVDHPLIKQHIPAKVGSSVQETLQEGDWVVARLISHPLRDNRFFFAEITARICQKDDNFAPWWVTLARHEQSRFPVEGIAHYKIEDQESRENLTALHFITIDSLSTKDMDDALYIEPYYQDGQRLGWKLTVAIADPSAYIPEDSPIEKNAAQRCFTNYLPGFNIPMLPRELSDSLCSLMENEIRPALVCEIHIDSSGEINGLPRFVLAYVQSKAKLVYDDVSDYLEKIPQSWQPHTKEIKEQLDELYAFAQTRHQWRKHHALIFSEQPDYEFALEDNGRVLNIHAQHRRTANKLVEEAMITANLCGAHYLEEFAKCGVFNTHGGVDPRHLTAANAFLHQAFSNDDNPPDYTPQSLATLQGYCEIQRSLVEKDAYFTLRLRRFLRAGEFKAGCEPHFGLGFERYATWTSPIRKYSDMVNHRLIKAVLRGKTCQTPPPSLLQRLQEARRQNRLVERDIADWLYCRYFKELPKIPPHFDGQIVDISRGGLRVRLCENGANIFIPLSTISVNKEEIQVNLDDLTLLKNGSIIYKLGDEITVTLTEIREETRSIVGTISTM